jgi:serine/threonine-protein kinase 24/25/MST4
MAPEVTEQSAYDFKADMWSLGIHLGHRSGQGVLLNSDHHPVRFLLVIPENNSPTLRAV